jgi:Arc/MetJ family transcription regulator
MISFQPEAMLMSTRKTSVEIDEDLFEEVRGILATSTMRETVEEAFREVVRREARREEIAALVDRRGLDLSDPRVMAGAWRR